MNIQGIARYARLYARSEAMVAEIRLRAYARKAALVGLAIVTAGMGLAFLNLAAYVYLQSVWGPVWTPLAIGIANFAIAALALMAAVLAKPSPELTLAHELRTLAANSLEEEFEASSSIGSLLGGGSDSSITRLLLPAVISIVGAMRQRKARAK